MQTDYQDTDKPSLLVVDDDVVIRGMLHRLLSDLGYQVIQAENGAEAVDAFKNNPIDAVLLDAAMPVMDGFTACREIKKLKGGAEVPVLMITALHDEQSVDKAFSVGALEYITKPIHWAVLRNRVHSLVKGRRAERALKRSEACFRGIFEQSAMGIALVDMQGAILQTNPSVQKLLETEAEQLRGQPFSKYFHPSDTRIEKEFYQQLIAAERRSYQMEKYFFQKNSPLMWARLTTSLVWNEDSQPQFVVCMIEDITQHKRSQIKQRIATRVFEATSDSVMIANAQGNIVDVNTSFVISTGYSYEEVLDKNPRLLRSSRHEQSFFDKMWNSLQDTGRWRGEIWNRRKNGEEFSQWLSISVVRGDNNEVTHYVAVYSDITQFGMGDEKLRQQVHYDERMLRLTHYDALTGLPNRLLLHERLTRACRAEEKIALMFIDLRNFRRVNETHGFDAGDSFLKVIAERLHRNAHDGDTVARLEGDEFGIILSISQPYDARLMAEKLFSEITQPAMVNNHELHLDCNIGISFYPGHDPENQQHDIASNVEIMIQHADVATYMAKEKGRNQYHIFSEEYLSGL